MEEGWGWGEGWGEGCSPVKSPPSLPRLPGAPSPLPSPSFPSSLPWRWREGVARPPTAAPSSNFCPSESWRC
eukprot:scaffold260069_cov19-Tisochrysis_lutea.AAC.1